MRSEATLLLCAALGLCAALPAQRGEGLRYRRTISITESARVEGASLTTRWKIVHDYRVQVTSSASGHRTLSFEIGRVHGWMAHGEEGAKAHFDSRRPGSGPARQLVATVGRGFRLDVDAAGRVLAVHEHAPLARTLTESKLLLHYDAPAPTDASMLSYWQQLLPGKSVLDESRTDWPGATWLYGHVLPITGRSIGETGPSGERTAEVTGQLRPLGAGTEQPGAFDLEAGRYRASVRLGSDGLPLVVSARVRAEGIRGLSICFNLGGPPYASDVRLVHDTRFERIEGDDR